MLVLVLESHRGLVAHFCRAEILDGAGIDIAGVVCPVVALCGEFLEGGSVEAYEGFLDYGLVLGVAALDVHHHGDGYTAGNPLYRRFNQVADRRHVACYACIDEGRCVEAERIAVVSVKVGGVCATAFISEEVVEGREFAVSVFEFLRSCKFVSNEA